MKMNLNIDMDTAYVKANVGTLSVNETRGKEYYLFKYSDDWLTHEKAFSIDPNLPLNPIVQNSSTLWGAFQDISPDRWGKMLQTNANNYNSPISFMLGVSDYMRMGGIRVSDQNNPEVYLSAHKNVPTLANIRELETAIRNFEKREMTAYDLKLLVDPGSSVGGARPKAVIEDGGKLYIAKFQSKKDDYRVINWEATALEMAKSAGINVPNIKLLNKDSEMSVLLNERFDRAGKERIHFASAMTMLSRQDGQESSYLELADRVKQISAQPKVDNYELWKRMTYGALIGNTDDHMRNHGFLRNVQGWRLSPAYDINPNPERYNIHKHATTFDGQSRSPSLDLCIDIAEYFGLNQQSVNIALKSIVTAIAQFDRLAQKNGITRQEIKQMEHLFKHEDIEKANTLIQGKSISKGMGKKI